MTAAQCKDACSFPPTTLLQSSRQSAITASRNWSAAAKPSMQQAARLGVGARMRHFVTLGLPMGGRARCVAARAGEPGVARPDIPQLAKMAQIRVTEQEVADWEPKIGSIVDWFGQLQAVDVEGVKPAVHARDEGNVLRPDAPAVYEHRDALMGAVPQQSGGFVRVPKIGTGADTPSASAASSLESSSSSSSSSSLSSSDDEAGAPAAAAAAAAAPGELSADELAALAALDVRVGRVISCERHPDADSLYVEQVDVGEPEPRTIVSGLVKYVPLEDMQGRPVIVLCNLKPRNMRGIKSAGMLLAASDAGHEVVEPLSPPPGAAPGSRVWWGEHEQQAKPMEPNPLTKKKVWEGVQPVLRTDAARRANFKGAAMRTAEGPVTSASLVDARIG